MLSLEWNQEVDLMTIVFHSFAKYTVVLTRLLSGLKIQDGDTCPSIAFKSNTNNNVCCGGLGFRRLFC